MAPEQLAGLGTDARTDLFGLGVLFWEMLVGQRDTEPATAHAIQTQSATPPSMLVPGLQPEIDALVMAMLAKLPASRPANAYICRLTR